MRRTKKSLQVVLIEELNSLYPVNLSTDIVCDRIMESDVFDEGTMDHMDLVLFGASHLSKIWKHFNLELWKLVAEVTETAASVNGETATVFLQLFDNSIYMVGGQGGEKKLLSKARVVPPISTVTLWWQTSRR